MPPRTWEFLKREGRHLREMIPVVYAARRLNRYYNLYRKGKISEDGLRQRLKKLKTERIDVPDERLSRFNATIATFLGASFATTAHNIIPGFHPFGNTVIDLEKFITESLKTNLGPSAYPILRFGAGLPLAVYGFHQGWKGRGAAFSDFIEILANAGVLTSKERNRRMDRFIRGGFRGGISALRTTWDLLKYNPEPIIRLAQKTPWPKNIAVEQTMGIPEAEVISLITYGGLTIKTSTLPGLEEKLRGKKIKEKERKKLEEFLKIARELHPSRPNYQ